MGGQLEVLMVEWVCGYGAYFGFVWRKHLVSNGSVGVCCSSDVGVRNEC